MSHLFLELGITLTAVFAGGRAVEALGKPHFLGEIGAGVLVGPAVLGALPASSFTRSFVVAVAVSAALTALGAVVSRDTVDLNRLEQRVDRLGDEAEGDTP